MLKMNLNRSDRELEFVQITERSYPWKFPQNVKQNDKNGLWKLGFENEENGKKELPSVQARKERDRKLSPASFTQTQ